MLAEGHHVVLAVGGVGLQSAPEAETLPGSAVSTRRSLRPHGTHWTLHTLRSHVALWTLRTLCAGWPLGTGRTLCTLRTLRAVSTSWSLRPGGTCGSRSVPTVR